MWTAEVSPDPKRAAQAVHILLFPCVEVLVGFAGPGGRGQHLSKLSPAGQVEM